MKQPGLGLRLAREERRVRQQHERMRALGDEIVGELREGRSDAASALLERFRDALEAHFQMEETQVLPGFHGSDPRAVQEITALTEEHEQLRRALTGRPNHLRFSEILTQIEAHEAREEALLRRLVAGDDRGA